MVLPVLIKMANITLIDNSQAGTQNLTVAGQVVDTDQVAFDPSTYLFTLNSQDITDNITRADKLANWPNFDPVIDNNRLAGKGVTPLTTSVTSIFFDRLITDPIEAPLDSAANAVNKAFSDIAQAADKVVNNVAATAANSPGIQALEKVLILGIITYIVFQGITLYKTYKTK